MVTLLVVGVVFDVVVWVCGCLANLEVIKFHECQDPQSLSDWMHAYTDWLLFLI